jgi:2-amino-4-hydroxy-6-hydroxymethyldihydropteridine diphosphokinase
VTQSESSPRSSFAAEAAWDVVIGLGSNLGDRKGMLELALSRLAEMARIDRVSAIYATAPIGPPQPDYLNAAVRLTTHAPPLALLAQLLEIERMAGRERRVRWGPRTLDLDFLWGRDLVVDEPALRVPHPELERRAFALCPLLDVAPEATDPRTGMPYSTLIRNLDTSSVRKCDGDLTVNARER